MEGQEQATETTGVEGASVAGEQSTEVQASESGANEQAAAEPEKQSNYEKAFAKRLSAKEAEWEAKYKDLESKYQGYEDYKFIADYMSKANNNADLMTLKEQIELEHLQERAEQANVPPDVLKRIDELEAKAAKAEEYEKQQEQTHQQQEFENTLKTFCEGKEIDGKPVDHKELWSYMFENGISKPEVAYKAMRADELEQKLQTAEKDAINKYLESKKAPKAEGSGAPGQTTFKPTGNLDSASERALARFRAARQSS